MVGGACCPKSSQCSPNGCILFNGDDSPPPITSTYVTTITSTIPASVSNYGDLDVFSASITVKTSTVTAVWAGAITPIATGVKEGEVEQKGKGSKSVNLGSWAKGSWKSSLGMLALVAGWMVML
jgi:hypothetical protein